MKNSKKHLRIHKKIKALGAAPNKIIKIMEGVSNLNIFKQQLEKTDVKRRKKNKNLLRKGLGRGEVTRAPEPKTHQRRLLLRDPKWHKNPFLTCSLAFIPF